MRPAGSQKAAGARRLAILLNPRMQLCVLLGFTSGLPLYVLIALVPVWLRSLHVDLATIGLFALVQFPYVWKFVWAPLLDRYRIPWLGRRRGVMLIGALVVLASMAMLGQFDPARDIRSIVVLCVVMAFASATLDIAIDAFRREILSEAELGPGNGIHVTAYKLSSLIPASLALVLSDHMAFSAVFVLTALFMLPGVVMALLVQEPGADSVRPTSLRGAVVDPFIEFFARSGLRQALLLLAFVLLYKLGDAMATSLSTAFYLDVGFTRTQIGLIGKTVGLWTSVVGGITGTALLALIGINRALWIFGVLQLVSILVFAGLALRGPDPLALALAIGCESFISVGLATAAFQAYLARATDVRYTATQYALLTSLVAVPRTLASSATGFIVQAIGWVPFFGLCACLALPGLALLPWVAPWSGRPERAKPGSAARADRAL